MGASVGTRIVRRRSALGNSLESDAPSKYKCTFVNVSDGVRCGTEKLEDELRCGKRECVVSGVPAHCPNLCEVNKTCETEAMCTFRIRVEMTGSVTVESFDSIGVDFAYRDHAVTDGGTLAEELINAVSQNEFVQGMIRDTVSQQVDKVQEKLDEWKVEVMDTLASEIGDNEVFGDYVWVRPYLDNSTELVQRLLPYAKLAVDPGENDTVELVMELPEAKTMAEARLCFTAADTSLFLWRFLPFATIAAVTSVKFQRAGLALAAIGLVVSSNAFVKELCFRAAPSMLGHTALTLSVPTPIAVQDLGFVDQVEFATSFIGNTLQARFAAIPQVAITDVIKNTAIMVGDANGTLPFKVVDGHFEMRPEGGKASIVAGTWCDLDAVLDARCAPTCEGCQIFVC